MAVNSEHLNRRELNYIKLADRYPYLIEPYAVNSDALNEHELNWIGQADPAGRIISVAVRIVARPTSLKTSGANIGTQSGVMAAPNFVFASVSIKPIQAAVYSTALVSLVAWMRMALKAKMSVLPIVKFDCYPRVWQGKKCNSCPVFP